VTLKIRKRKLAQTSGDSSSLGLVSGSNVLSEATNSLITDFNSNLNSLDNTNFQPTVLNSKLKALSVKIEASRQFNLSVLSNAQLTALFFS
jgi:hypothetical protein